MCAASLKFENEVHLGHIWFSEAGFVYSASKGANSSVGLPVFFGGHLPPAEMASFFIKNTDLQKKMEHFRIFCSHSVLPTKMTCGNLFIFFFWSPIAVGHSALPTKTTYGNLFIFVFC